MCGIAAIYAYHYAAPEVGRDELCRIGNHMASRGPDGQGKWFSRDQRVALANRRLAVIDLSERAAQPMVSENGQVILSFNGEIYNYRMLRRELEKNGHVFRSDSDTEVLLHLYAEKGDAMVHDLRGMFAFALWDAQKGAMLLARDPYGIKPLYYANDGWTVRAASQVKALLAGGKVSTDPEPAGIVGFYLFGHVPEPYTTYQEIRLLPAGCILWICDTGPDEPKRYFNLARVFKDAVGTSKPVMDGEVQHEVRAALADSVAHHLVADVPVGAFLSAGVDSGALVGLMRDAGQNNIQTITLTFEEFQGSEQDEGPFAEQVATRYDTQHTTRLVTEDEFRRDLPRILEAMDQPSIDGINTWFVSKAAKELGLKVAISGLGGDELFGGYSSFREIPRWVQGLRVPSKIPFLGELFRLSYGAFVPSSFGVSPKAAGMLKYGGSYPGAYLLRRGIFMPWELRSLREPDLFAEGLRRLQPLKHIRMALEPDPGTRFARVAALEASLYMRNQLLRDTDWASMNHSLEVRTPLVDVALLHRIAPLLVNECQPQTKPLLANSPSRPLPPSISKRPKTGFCVPIGPWTDAEQGLSVPTGGKTLRPTGGHQSRRLVHSLSHIATHYAAV